MHPSDCQRIDWHQPREPAGFAFGRQHGFLAACRRRRFVFEIKRFGADQPVHFVVALDAKIGAEHRCITAKAAHTGRGQRRHHVHDHRVVTIDNTYLRHAENPCLRARVGLHRCVPVEMILRDVEHRRRLKAKAGRGFQLKTRQFENPGGRQVIRVERFHERMQTAGADVAGDAGTDARRLQKVPRERGHRCFSVGSRDPDDLRVVTP